MTQRAAVTLWVVYHSPDDYPGRYVVRAQDAHADGTVRPHPAPWLVTRDLEPVHLALARLGLTRLDRHPDDAPAILEVWV